MNEENLRINSIRMDQYRHKGIVKLAIDIGFNRYLTLEEWGIIQKLIEKFPGHPNNLKEK